MRHTYIGEGASSTEDIKCYHFQNVFHSICNLGHVQLKKKYINKQKNRKIVQFWFSFFRLEQNQQIL